MIAGDRNTQDIARTTLTVLFIGILIASSIWILRPFLSSIVWATIIVVATWPALLAIQRVFRCGRGLAVTVMTLILLLTVMVPLVGTIAVIVGRSDDISSTIKTLGGFTVPPVPAWVSGIPLGGGWLAERWQHIASLSPEALAAMVVPYASKLLNWFVAQAGSMVGILIQFLLTVVLSAVMYSGGEKTAMAIKGFARRLGGQNGEELVVLAGKAIRSVALGVVVTALVQTAIAGIGLYICGAPFTMLLTAAVLVLCLAQLGPILALLPVVIWLYWKGDPVWGTVLLVFMIVANLIDNFLRPMLIRKGVDLPLLLIFAGVIGGLISFGAIGMFIGPVVLAVAYTVSGAWISGSDERTVAATPGK